MKTETPITNAVAKSILDELAAVKNNNEYKVAVKGMTHRLLKLCQSLEKDADMRLEWIAREIQQMPDMGGGKPYQWEKLDERDKDNWRMRADEAARRMASNEKLTDPRRAERSSATKRNKMSETSNGQAGRGFGAAHGYAYFVDSEIGMTMGDTTVKQLPDGTWKATAPIGTLFGSEVEGECNGTGATKEAALEALAKDRKNLNDSLWA